MAQIEHLANLCSDQTHGWVEELVWPGTAEVGLTRTSIYIFHPVIHCLGEMFR